MVSEKALRPPRQAASSIAYTVLIVGVFCGAFVLRFLNQKFHSEHFIQIAGGRQIVAHGNLPVRDFIDPGQFLLYWISAVGQWIFGYRLLGDGLISISLISLTTALVFVLSTEAAKSKLIGLVATLLFFMSSPHLYNYYKLLFPTLTIYLCWRYADDPTARRLLFISITSAIALMARADVGAYSIAGTSVTLLCVHGRDGWQILANRFALFGGALLLAVTPYLVFLQFNGGIVEQYVLAIDYGRGEKSAFPIRPLPLRVETEASALAIGPPRTFNVSVRWKASVRALEREEMERRFGLTSRTIRTDDPRGRTWTYTIQDISTGNLLALTREPRIDDLDGIDGSSWLSSIQQEMPLLRLEIAPGLLTAQNTLAWLYYGYWLLPIVAAAMVAWHALLRVPIDRPQNATPKILAAATAAILANFVLMSLPTHNRMSDVGALLAVLFAWILGQILAGRRGPGLGRWIRYGFTRLLPALLLVGLTWGGIRSMAGIGPQLQGTSWPVVMAGPGAIVARARKEVNDLMKSPPIDAVDGTAVRSLAAYVRECTHPTDAVLLTWHAAPLYFLSDRPHAGGVPYFHDSHFSEPATQAAIMRRLQNQRVPIVVSETRAYDRYFSVYFTSVHEYLSMHYQVIEESGFGDVQDRYRVLVDRRLAPSGTDSRLGLPCYA